MKSNAFFILFLSLALTGCVQPEPDAGSLVPPDLTGPPVMGTKAPEMTGQWYGDSQLSSSAALWLTPLPERPDEAYWIAEWTPERPGGYLVMTGLVAQPVQDTHLGRDMLHFTEEFSWAQPSEDAWVHQGTLQSLPRDDFDDWYLLFIVHAADAEGEIKILLDWGGGEGRRWAPADSRAATASIEEHVVHEGGPVNRNLPMDGFAALHVIMPCKADGDEISERLSLEMGAPPANRITLDGTRDGNLRENWPAHGGLWSYSEPDALVKVTYEGPKTQELAIVRSTFDPATVVEDLTGHRAWIRSQGHACQPQVDPADGS